MPTGIVKDTSRSRFVAAAIVFAASFALYCFTLAPTVTLVDSGELILAAHGLGVAHPPGFPLYVLLAHLASLVPAGSVAVRIHLASALFAALAAATMTLLVTELMLVPVLKRTRKNEKKKSTEDDAAAPPSMALVLGTALLAGLLFAFSRTLWAYATIAEVYTLNAFLIVTVLWLMFGWRREFLAAHADKADPSYQKLYIAALVFGLAMGVHHVTVVLFLPSLAVLVYGSAGKQFFMSRRFLYAALIAIAGLSIYIYLPLAASRSPLMNWGDPRTLDALWRHVTGKQYQVFFEFSAARMLDSIRLLSRELGVVWLPAGLVFAAAGFADGFRKARLMFWFLIVVVLLDIVYCLFYGPTEDKDAYYLPAFISIIIAASYGFRWAMRSISDLLSVLTPGRTALILLAVPVIALASNFAYNDRHRYYLAHDYVENTLAAIEPRGMLITSDWQLYSPSLYVREIEGQRRDAILLDMNLLRRSWYFGYLEQAYPDTMARSRDKVNALVEDIRAWERDPAAYARNASLNQRINTRFQDLLFSLVTEQLKTAPLYVTLELVDSKSGEDLGLIKLLRQKYDVVPQGLVFRVVEKGSPFIAPPPISTRGLNDGTLTFDYDDVAKRAVVPAYLNMLTNTGLYLVANSKDEQAARYFQQALAIDPSYELAKRGLAASQQR